MYGYNVLWHQIVSLGAKRLKLCVPPYHFRYTPYTKWPRQRNYLGIHCRFQWWNNPRLRELVVSCEFCSAFTCSPATLTGYILTYAKCFATKASKAPCNHIIVIIYLFTFRLVWCNCIYIYTYLVTNMKIILSRVRSACFCLTSIPGCLWACCRMHHVEIRLSIFNFSALPLLL